MSLKKKATITEGIKLQMRLEAFNVLNRVNLGTPNLRVFDNQGRRQSNAGQINSTSKNSRQIQIAMRLVF